MNSNEAFLARAVAHFEKTEELPGGSTSELLMVAFAVERWDLVSDIGLQFRDPLNAWFYRLNDQQRDAVLNYRTALAEHICTMEKRRPRSEHAHPESGERVL